MAADGPPEVRCHVVVSRDDVAFIGRSSGLLVMDVTDPIRPKEIGKLVIPATVYDIVFAGETGYLATGSHGLYVVDVSEPGQPRVLQHHETPGRAHAVRIKDAHALIADDQPRPSDRGSDVKDPTEPSTPSLDADAGAERDAAPCCSCKATGWLTAERERRGSACPRRHQGRPCPARVWNASTSSRGARALAEDGGVHGGGSS